MAQAADFTLQRFDEVINVNVDGSFDVSETLLVDFVEPKHGLYRVIPTQYQTEDGATLLTTMENVSVTDLGGGPIETTVKNDGALTLRIGSADKTVYGPQYYVIHYRVRGALVELSDRVELYWNVTGTEWDAPPLEASVQVKLPNEAAVIIKEDLQLACYTGEQGSAESNCTTGVSGKTMMAGTSGGYLTIAFAWPKGIVDVPAPLLQTPTQAITETLAGGSGFAVVVWLLPFLVFLFMFLHWRKHGRDPKGRGTIVPEYEPPKDLRAGEVGMLLASWVDNRYLSAGIVQLAVLGHLKIAEVIEERFGPDRKTFTLERTGKGEEELRAWEKALLLALFKDGAMRVTEDDLKPHFARDKAFAVSALEDRLLAEGYFFKHPKRARIGWMIVGGVITFLGFQMFIPAVMLTGGIFLLFGWLMAKRTQKGAEALDGAKGFKLFLTTAEKYRLQWQEKEGIFEKYLPYAMVFGVADKWAKAFAAVHVEPVHPAWYIGPSLMNFNAVDFTSRMNQLTQQMSAVAAPKGGASGGGGFSGGGFGGGGGGSW